MSSVPAVDLQSRWALTFAEAAAALAISESTLRRIRPQLDEVAAVVDASSSRSRAAYARTVAAWRLKTERAIRRAGVDLMDVPVPRVARKDAVTGPILRFFRMRQQRGAKR